MAELLVALAVVLVAVAQIIQGNTSRKRYMHLVETTIDITESRDKEIDALKRQIAFLACICGYKAMGGNRDIDELMDEMREDD
jgi:hypothetical protein